MTDKISKKERMNEIIEATMKVARGDYSVQVGLSGQNDEFDSLAMGLNMMIDDIRTAEEALQESEEKYRSLIESSGAAITYFDGKGTYLLLNEMAASWLNGKPEDYIGKTVHDVFPKDIADMFRERFNRIIKSGIGEAIEEVVEPLNRCIYSRLQPVKGKSGKTTGVQIVTFDITERKRLEHDLKERVKELQCLHGIAEIAERPDITYEELYQETVNLIPAAWQYPEITCARAIFDNKQFETENYRDSRWKQSSDIEAHGVKVGSVEVIYLEERPEIDEGPFLKEERLLIDAVARQLGRITERMQAEELLRQSEENLKAYLERAPDGVYLHDLKGTFLYGNKKAEEITGYKREELIGMSFLKLNLLPKKYLAKAGKLLVLNTMGKPTGPDEFELTRKNGSRVWTEINTTPIKQGGKVVVIGFVRDITERKQAEEEREALLKELERINRRLEESNRELQDFVYIASHDLREPLRKITSFGTLLQGSLGGKLDEDQQENFKFMIDGSKRMQTMIDDLLTYSRITTKAKSFQQVNLNNVIEDLKNLELAALLDETKGTIHVPEMLPPVYGDLSQIHQLLQNLVANGLKFHRQGVPPEITIRARRIENNMVRVEVQDNGIGIAKEYYEQVFTMFKRLHSRTQYKGTGIGLAACKKIVQRHGGEIGIKSTPGEGSIFWFTLPRGSYSGND